MLCVWFVVKSFSYFYGPTGVGCSVHFMWSVCVVNLCVCVPEYGCWVCVWLSISLFLGLVSLRFSVRLASGWAIECVLLCVGVSLCVIKLVSVCLWECGTLCVCVWVTLSVCEWVISLWGNPVILCYRAVRPTYRTRTTIVHTLQQNVQDHKRSSNYELCSRTWIDPLWACSFYQGSQHTHRDTQKHTPTQKDTDTQTHTHTLTHMIFEAYKISKCFINIHI